MKSIYTMFKVYTKQHIVSYLNKYVTDRININMTVDKIIYTLDCYLNLKGIERDFDDYANGFFSQCDFWNLKQ